MLCLQVFCVWWMCKLPRADVHLFLSAAPQRCNHPAQEARCQPNTAKATVTTTRGNLGIHLDIGRIDWAHGLSNRYALAVQSLVVLEIGPFSTSELYHPRTTRYRERVTKHIFSNLRMCGSDWWIYHG